MALCINNTLLQTFAVQLEPYETISTCYFVDFNRYNSRCAIIKMVACFYSGYQCFYYHYLRCNQRKQGIIELHTCYRCICTYWCNYFCKHIIIRLEICTLYLGHHQPCCQCASCRYQFVAVYHYRWFTIIF